MYTRIFFSLHNLASRSYMRDPPLHHRGSQVAPASTSPKGTTGSPALSSTQGTP
jgi:hypothetical protein